MKKLWIVVLAIACGFAAREAKSAFPTLPSGVPNKYHLTTEDQLTPQHRRTIEAYVQRHSQHGTFVSDRGGAVIHYRRLDAPNEKGAIVIVSGRTESMLIYSELLYDLHRQGYSLFIHDHRGQGFSGGRLKATPERGYVSTFDDYVADLEKFMNTVVGPSRKTNLYLLAHSMGGGIASLYLERPQNAKVFKAAALVTPMHEPLLPISGHDFTKGICEVEQILGAHLNQAEYVKGTPRYEVTPFAKNDLTHSKVRYEIVQSIYEGRKRLRVEWPTRGWVREACLAGERARKNASHIVIPVLVLQASKDTAVRADGQFEFCAGVRAPGICHPWVIEQSYHAVFIEADTFRIPALTKVLDFFARPDRQ